MSNITIVGLGDSTTAGTPYASSYRGPDRPVGGNPQAPYTYWVAHRHPEWMVLNRGVNGERTDQIRARLQSQVVPAHPRYVVILAGINDTYSGYPMDQSRVNLEAMYHEAQLNGIIPIACTVLPFDQAAIEDREKIRSLNDWIRTSAKTAHRPLIDLNAVARDPKNPDHLRGSPDGLHPDLATYKLMGEAVADHIEQLEAQASVPR